MAQLKVLLGGLLCRFFARQARRDRRAAALPSGKAEERRQRHLQRCSACRVRQLRERQYLQRLRNAAVPAASDDLTARLLARTGALAATRQDAADETPADKTPAGDGEGPGVPPAPLPAVRFQQASPRRSPLRLAAAVTGGVAAATALTAGTAYLMGGEPQPAAGGVPAPAFSDSLAEPLSGTSLSAVSAANPAWRLSSEPDVVPAESLSAEQLTTLRAQGWACPELRELGYHLVWARAGAANGTDVLEMRLTDGGSFATVLEQHAAGNPAAPPAGTVPVNVLTGHPAAADGFVSVPLQDAGNQDSGGHDAGSRDAADHGEAAGPGTLWINRQVPFRAIYQSAGATFTFVAESSRARPEDGVVAALVHSRPAAAPAAPVAASAAETGGDAWQSRLERGLQRVVELLAR